MEIDDQLGLAWAAQGLIYMNDMESDDKAREALKKAIELNPSYAMAYMWYGSLQKDFDKKLELHKKAFQLDPKSTVAGFNVAMNLFEKGKDKEAMEVFSKIVDADPFYPGAYQLVAIINEYNGRIDQAIINYRKSYDLSSNLKSAINLSQLYIDLGDYTQAEKWLKIASEGNNPYYDIGIQWSEVAILLGKKDFDSVKQAIKKMIKNPAKDLPHAMSEVTANYVIEDYSAVIKSFENAKSYVSDWGKELFNPRSA